MPPFFDPKADRGINSSGIGALVGHEFRNGFDDEGCKSDDDGLLRGWWIKKYATKFQGRATEGASI